MMCLSALRLEIVKLAPVLVACLTLSLLVDNVLAQTNRTAVQVAVVKHFDEYYTDPIDSLFLQELEALLGTEFEPEIIEYRVGWSQEDVAELFTEIYADPEIDVVLVLGFAANQRVLKLKSFDKPTFLPFVLESRSLSEPQLMNAATRRNLSYLTYSTQFLDSIDLLKDVVDFDNIAIVADQTVFSALPDELQESLDERYNGVNIERVPHDGSDAPLISLIPETAEAVILGLLPRLSEGDTQALIDGLIERGIPSFSYLGKGLVERGVLATVMNDSVYQQAARINALNIQAVLLGGVASEQPVMVDTPPKIQINQKTAEQIGLAINFRTLINADVIGFGQGLNAQEFTLKGMVQELLTSSLLIRNQSLVRDIQKAQAREARGALLPQVFIDGSYLERKSDSAIVSSGFAAADSTDVSVGLSQSLFSPSRWASASIQKTLNTAAEEQLREVTLDAIREGALAIADVLQAQAEAEINQENLEFSESNLELARDRVGLGAASIADQYRWEVQVANNRAAVFAAYSRLLITQQNLNRVLNRDIHLPVTVSEVNMDELLLFSVDEIFAIMDNADTFEHLYFLALERSTEVSPELARLNQLVKAKRREVKALVQQRYLPEVELSGQLSENLDSASPQMTDGKDWQVLVAARIPLFQGGTLRAKKQKAKLELKQLETQSELINQELSSGLRRSMNNVLTSLFNLDFSTQAASASAASLTLVTQAYNEGAVSIVELLDSQNANITASLGAVQARIAFFRAAIEMQRIMGGFDFLLQSEDRETLRKEYFEQFARYKASRSTNKNATTDVFD